PRDREESSGERREGKRTLSRDDDSHVAATIQLLGLLVRAERFRRPMASSFLEAVQLTGCLNDDEACEYVMSLDTLLGPQRQVGPPPEFRRESQQPVRGLCKSGLPSRDSFFDPFIDCQSFLNRASTSR